jgi:hypothetical protein
MIGKPYYKSKPYNKSIRPDIEQIYIKVISRYLNDVDLLQKHIDKLDWILLSQNPYAIPILEQHQDKLDWWSLSQNPNAIPILNKNKHKICWINICLNKNSISLIHFKLKHKYLQYYYEFSNIPILRIIKNSFEIACDGYSKYIIMGNIIAIVLQQIYLHWNDHLYMIVKSIIHNLFKIIGICMSTVIIADVMVCVYVSIFKCSNDINWNLLSENPYVISILEKNLDKINWLYLSGNLNAIPILEKNIDKVEWWRLSCNPNAISILEENLDKINWEWLSENRNAIYLLKQNLDKICWWKLSYNPNAISILEENLDKVSWIHLSGNRNAIHLLEKNLDKICWSRLSSNINAIPLLEKNMDKIVMDGLLSNENSPYLFIQLDQHKMKENMKQFHEELVTYVLHPDRILRLCNQYDLNFIDYITNNYLDNN